MAKAKARLRALGFTIHDNWLLRLIQRWLKPQSFGGVFEYQNYIESISATGGAACDRNPLHRRWPCSSLSIKFVRFPSGRLRVLSLRGTESLPAKHLASETITNLMAQLGQPSSAKWKIVTGGGRRLTCWEGHWQGQRVAEWLSVNVNLSEEVPVKAGTLSPPDLERSVHASSIDFSFYARPVGFAAETAWSGQKANWIADQHTGCRLWNTFPREGDTVRWDGQCVNGYANGYGRARWSAFGREYEVDEGEFRAGKLNGYAVITAGRDSRFEGEFRDNRPDGHGTLEEDGVRYSGNWSKGCFAQDGKRAAFFADRDLCDAF